MKEFNVVATIKVDKTTGKKKLTDMRFLTETTRTVIDWTFIKNKPR